MPSLFDTRKINIRKLILDDLSEIKEIQSVILKSSGSEFIYPKSEEHFLNCIYSNSSTVFGLVIDKKIVAIGVLNIQRENQRNKASRFKIIPDEEWRYHSCFIESAMVLPEYRGIGFQKRLIDVRIAAAINAGKKWLCAGVKFRNYGSWKNLLSKGFIIVGYRLERDHLIFGLTRKLTEIDLQFDCGTYTIVALSDEQGHRDALDNGLFGIDLTVNGSRISVIYKLCYIVK